MPEIEPLTQLLAIEQIKQVKARYFRSIDTKDIALLRTVFTDDATFDVRCSVTLEPDPEGRGYQEGGDAITAFIAAAIAPNRCVHHGHCHEIEVLSETEARGVIAMEDMVYLEADQSLIFHGMGHYHETYRKVDGQWRIHTLRLSRVHVILG
jgi:hypothetical protein